ncbi:sulfotransferase family protein [Streptomyces sp. V4-01]|uniref:Sulfotransferase family protein n=1 Tax=Actinacidiphila polyblastidii TaxID=3110430 RepID=A0ABU7PB07_9ACTN|nr:sulfotransferase family protein [Streptomyces sp. V4-01]
MPHPILFMWSTPRALSTAFLRMMAERGDFLVVHEPFSSIVAEGHTTIDGVRLHHSADVTDLLREKARETGVFVKEVTDARYDLLDDPGFPYLGTHTFLLRHPEQTIASHYAMKNEVTCDEIGYGHLLDLFETVRPPFGDLPVVVEAENLITAPEAVVRDYCRRTGIPFVPEAMDWSPQDRPEWQRTAAWHRDAARSSGFNPVAKQYPVNIHNDGRLAALYAAHIGAYEQLRAYAAGAVGTAVPARRPERREMTAADAR